LAFLLTNLLEMPVAWVFLRKTESAGKIATIVLLCNLLTLPFVWFVFPALLSLPYIQMLALAEVFAFAVEMGLYAAVFKKAGKIRAMGAAFAANALSLLVGLIL